LGTEVPDRTLDAVRPILNREPIEERPAGRTQVKHAEELVVTPETALQARQVEVGRGRKVDETVEGMMSRYHE
jgi:phosphopantetheine adenylyltransferase